MPSPTAAHRALGFSQEPVGPGWTLTPAPPPPHMDTHFLLLLRTQASLMQPTGVNLRVHSSYEKILTPDSSQPELRLSRHITEDNTQQLGCRKTRPRSFRSHLLLRRRKRGESTDRKPSRWLPRPSVLAPAAGPHTRQTQGT